MSRFQDRTLTEAAEWFARRRRGVMTITERSGYDDWLLKPANAAAMAEMERLWQAAGESRAGETTVPRAAAVRLNGFARSALVAILCMASLGAGIISLGSHSTFWTRLDWIER